VRVIDVEKLGLPKKGDAVDWCKANPAATAAAIAALPCIARRCDGCEAQPAVEPVSYRWVSDIKAKPIRWLWTSGSLSTLRRNSAHPPNGGMQRRV